MNDIPYNYGNKLPCEMGCNVPLNNEHLIKCNVLSEQSDNKLELNTY